ncbi:type VI secretion system tip protein VgrG [Klebsiella pneumoniae]|uniref:type VI secretion system tip protein VgrG n=5 Tax=Klebsiella pneumoniae TaxID=573 RepID=UPI00217DF9F8|nr:type VI secretion system Vgr family protein [Klebsiella pneumoniae]MCS6081491.1 type VI secretion system tip protein VgrG [Klebsiella pneumoniae subsp. pneumoniae]HBW0999742.1 type VI secretion system tip protein VgrG [Klebsiella pneumoniae]
MKSLLFSHNHHLLSVKGCEAGLDVLAFEGDEALSQPFRYRIEFTSADHAIGKEMMLMKAASLTLQAPVAQGFGINVQQPVRVIQGVVTGFERLSTSRDETHYALTLEPRLALLNRSHQNAIYQDQSVPQIVEKILRERHGLRGQDFLFSLTKTYPRREQVMQYGEDDLRFITRLLGEVGIWFRFTADTRLHIDVAEFCDSQQGYEKGLTLPSVPPSGQQSAGVDAVWEMACRHRVVEQQVSTRDYNYREATADMNAQVDVTRGETTTFGEAYHWGDNYLTAGNVHDRHPAPESGAFYARLRHERYLNGQTRMQATTSCPTLRAQKGIFISADGQAQAQGQVLDMEPAVSNLAEAREQMMSISGDAQKATANPADLQAQITLLEQQLTDLKKSVLLVSAPEGIALTSGEHLQVSAGHNLIATAGKNADVSVVKNLFIGVGSALSVFVRKLGIRLIANQGPVQMQAQNDLMALLARKEISIVSTEDSIEIIAKKRVTINGGGSYITLNASGIESATAGEYRTRAGYYVRREKAQHKPDIAPLANAINDGSHNIRYLCTDDNGVPMMNTPYRAFLADGSVLEGVSDGEGYTKLFTSAQIQDVLLHMIPEAINA